MGGVIRLIMGSEQCFRSNISASGKLLTGSLGFLFAVVALFCHLQATRNVCAVLAAKGAKEKGDYKHFEKVRDSDELAAQKAVAWTVVRDSVGGALLVGITSAIFLAGQ